jgi:heme b synthase
MDILPRLVFWEVTAGCNLKCIHCRAQALPGRLPDELTTEEAFRFIEHLRAFASPIVVLSGGEPLYRPDIFDIASFASGKGLKVALATNATLVTPEIARRIKEAGISRVSVSLDGATSSTHDTFRAVAGSFERAIKGFMNIKDTGVDLQINTTVTKHNVNELPEILDLAIGLGACALHIFMLVPTGCGLTIKDEQMLPAVEYERVLEWFYEKSKEVNINLKATCAPHYFRIMRQKRGGHAAGHSVRGGMEAITKGCLAGSGVFFVSYKGDVFPCGYLPVYCGNVLKENIKDIWEESEVFARLREPGMLKGKCGMCEYRVICAGCRARAYSEEGDYLAEEPYCIYVPKVKGASGG